MRRLRARPGPSVALLGKDLKPAAALEEKAVRRLLRGLDADDFETRRRCAAELATVAEQAEPLLRQALEKAPSPEVRRHLEGILEGLQAPSPERLRLLRAVEVLEAVGTPEALRVLEGLVGGAPGAPLTREAKAALGRLKKRGG
jgi:hypothetical protein